MLQYCNIKNSAQVIGDVVIGEESSVWFSAIVRGDVNYIRIGARTNIQDNSVIHVTHDTHPKQFAKKPQRKKKFLSVFVA